MVQSITHLEFQSYQQDKDWTVEQDKGQGRYTLKRDDDYCGTIIRTAAYVLSAPVVFSTTVVLSVPFIAIDFASCFSQGTSIGQTDLTDSEYREGIRSLQRISETSEGYVASICSWNEKVYETLGPLKSSVKMEVLVADATETSPILSATET